MASFRKRGAKWEAFVATKGVRKSKSFHTKIEATEWARTMEAEIIEGEKIGVVDKTFGELLEEYRNRVSCGKKSNEWEKKRCAFFQQDPIADIKLKDLSAPDFADWRDRRLLQTKSGTVLRDWSLLNNALNIAVKEWEWLPSNPMSKVRRPSAPPPRERIVQPDEIEKMEIILGTNLDLVGGRLRLAMLFAHETAMRCGEIAALRKSDIDLKNRVAKVQGVAPGAGKNRAARREVPLSSKAVEIVNQLGDDLFNLTAQQIDINFRKARIRAGLDGFTFHDLRHNAITNLAKKLPILDLARAVGHGNIQELMTYYKSSAKDMAKQLD